MRVEVCGVSKRFGAVEALCDVSCEIPEGRRVALVGPNGSGKSTLNRVLVGLLEFEGDVRLDGHSPRAGRLDVARRLAYVPQLAPALAQPVGELVARLAELRGADPGRVVALATELELDLQAVAHRPFRALSGGMKQKLLLALALAADATLLVLDEPTGSLDARSREKLWGLFAELPKETTLILCSHRLDEVRQLVDHVLVLEEGRLVHDGSARAFLETATRSVIEVLARGDAAELWLAEHGFARRASGWWSRLGTRAEKRELLAKLGAILGSGVEDVIARDLEWLEDGGSDGDA